MLPLMERELVEHRKWLTEAEFIDQVTLAQTLPGVFAVNMAAMSGYRLRGYGGSVAAIVGNVVVPIVVILLLASVLRSFRDVEWVQHVFMGVRPAVVALIAVPVFKMGRQAGVGWSNCWVPVVAAATVVVLGVNPALVVLAAAVAGWVYGRLTKNRPKL